MVVLDRPWSSASHGRETSVSKYSGQRKKRRQGTGMTRLLLTIVYDSVCCTVRVRIVIIWRKEQSFRCRILLFLSFPTVTFLQQELHKATINTDHGWDRQKDVPGTHTGVNVCAVAEGPRAIMNKQALYWVCQAKRNRTDSSEQRVSVGGFSQLVLI